MSYQHGKLKRGVVAKNVYSPILWQKAFYSKCVTFRWFYIPSTHIPGVCEVCWHEMAIAKLSNKQESKCKTQWLPCSGDVQWLLTPKSSLGCLLAKFGSAVEKNMNSNIRRSYGSFNGLNDLKLPPPPSEDELLQPSSLRPEQLQPFATNSCQLGAAGGAGSGDGSTRFDMMRTWGML